jgi:hypothetical protein
VTGSPSEIVKRVTLLAAGVGIALAIAVAAGCGGSDSADHFQMMQFGPGMMGYGSVDGGEPVQDLAAAKEQAQRFADQLGLQVGEVMRFTRNYYAELTDESGKLATEVLVDPRSGSVWFEYGPAMMWNTEYGMMGGAMGGGTMMGGGIMGGGPFGDPSWGLTQDLESEPTLSVQEAERIATKWLSSQGSDLRAGKAEQFPGYSTLHVLRNRKIVGMLSVNAYTGALWYHWWHGRFLGMEEEE